MKVKITSGSSWLWYGSLVGQVLEIDAAEESLMWYITSGEHKGRAVYKADVEIKISIKETVTYSIDSVEYPETKSAEQIQLEVLQEKIAELTREAEKLQGLINK